MNDNGSEQERREGCGGQVRVLACLEDPLVMGKILAPLETQQAVAVGEGRRPAPRVLSGGALKRLCSKLNSVCNMSRTTLPLFPKRPMSTSQQFRSIFGIVDGRTSP